MRSELEIKNELARLSKLHGFRNQERLDTEERAFLRGAIAALQWQAGTSSHSVADELWAMVFDRVANELRAS